MYQLTTPIVLALLSWMSSALNAADHPLLRFQHTSNQPTEPKIVCTISGKEGRFTALVTKTFGDLSIVQSNSFTASVSIWAKREKVFTTPEYVRTSKESFSYGGGPGVREDHKQVELWNEQKSEWFTLYSGSITLNKQVETPEAKLFIQLVDYYCK